MSEKILVDKEALGAIINALNGPGHYIREIQMTRNIGALGGGKPNPIDVLMADMKSSHKASNIQEFPTKATIDRKEHVQRNLEDINRTLDQLHEQYEIAYILAYDIGSNSDLDPVVTTAGKAGTLGYLFTFLSSLIYKNFSDTTKHH